MNEAKKFLNPKEIARFKMTLKEYIKKGIENGVDGHWVKQLESASNIYHMKRLTALKLQIQEVIEQTKALEISGVTNLMTEICIDGYYHTAYEIQKGLEYGFAFATLDKNKIEKILLKPWAVDGSSFSNRLWLNKTKLLYNLETRLTQSIIRGDTQDKLIKSIAEVMNVSRGVSGRLVMTECAYFSSVSRIDCYKELGIKQFQFVSTLDLKTSAICREMDNQVIDLTDYEIGTNAPPLHPWCRSTTVPYFNNDIGERFARNMDSTYKIRGNMSYNEWYNIYAKGEIT